MRIKTVEKIFFYFLILLFTEIAAEEYALINFGVIFGGAPSIEKTFNREMRIRLSSVEGLMATDYDLSSKIKRDADFENDPVLSPKLINSIRSYSADRSIVAWVKIDVLSIVPKRKAVVTAVAAGKLRVKLFLYSLYFGEYLYSSTIETTAEIKKGALFFRPAEKIIHITAQENRELSKEMVAKSIDEIEELVTAIVRSELLKSGTVMPSTVKKERAPSVSDMFNIPSAEFEE